MAQRENYTFENHASLPAGLGSTLASYFQSWDDPHSNNEYLNLFTPDSELVFGQTPVKGKDGIRGLREAMVQTGPSSTSSTPSKRPEVVINGTVWFKLKNGRRVDTDFASWIVFKRRQGEQLQAVFYKVYIDPAELQAAIKEMVAAEQ
ncbi:putative fungal specific transcription protein [Fonsecaea pedrosoi]|nr:putative fungal specific transcription protein [Fonsecaea pedrosoi]